MISLSKLSDQHETATISSIVCDPEDRVRYFALGFIPGSSIRLYKTTVLNGPKIYDICDTRIAIRDQDAERIYVSLT